jgi:hypothetical protein
LSKPKPPRLQEVLWWFNKEKVLTEIAEIIGVDSVTEDNPEWFQHRTKATKNILDNMTDAEMKDLRMKADEIVEKGMPEDLKRK